MESAAHAPDVEERRAARLSGGSLPTGRGGGAVPPRGVLSPEDVEELLALVAHELRTPQAVVAAAADVLTGLLDADDLDRADIERIADVIRRHSRLSARLVARLSVTHEIGQGAVTLQTEQLDLAPLVEEIVSDVAAFVLPERTVTVSASGPVPAVVDRASISEILFNLLSNADKFSAADAAIQVQVHRDQRGARVVVRDEGSGVAPGDTEAIFEPYVQTGADRGGVGLGLYVSRELARAHGGELSVRPATDVGSVFVLELLDRVRPSPQDSAWASARRGDRNRGGALDGGSDV